MVRPSSFAVHRLSFVLQLVQPFPEIFLPLLYVLQLILQKSPLIFRRHRPGIPSPAITGSPTVTLSISTTPAMTVTPAITKASSAHRYIIHISRHAVAGTVSGPSACHRPFSVRTCSISSWHNLILLYFSFTFESLECGVWSVELKTLNIELSLFPLFHHSIIPLFHSSTANILSICSISKKNLIIFAKDFKTHKKEKR